MEKPIISEDGSITIHDVYYSDGENYINGEIVFVVKDILNIIMKLC